MLLGPAWGEADSHERFPGVLLKSNDLHHLNFHRSTRGQKLNPNIFFSNFSGASGISRQNPGISRQKSLIPWVSRDIPNFLAPTLSRGRPPPHRKISGLKSLGLGSFFVPDPPASDSFIPPDQSLGSGRIGVNGHLYLHKWSSTTRQAGTRGRSFNHRIRVGVAHKSWECNTKTSSAAVLVAHDCGYPPSRYTCRATRVATDFLDFIAFCRCSTGVALHPQKILVSHLPTPPCREVSHRNLGLKRCRATRGCPSYSCGCRATLCN